jgi:hypothetical protein
MNPIMLILTLMTAGADTPDITHKVPEPTIEKCWADAASFLKAGIPPGTSKEVVGIMAACAQKRDTDT